MLESRYRLEQYTVRGSEYEMGIQYGDYFRSKIQAFVEMRLASAETYFSNWGRGDVDQLKVVGAQCWERAQRFHPEGAAEHMGIAKGAELSPDLLYAATNMTDVRDVVLLPNTPPPTEDEGCTSALIPPQNSRVSGGIYGQTWDLNPPDIEYIIALHRVPNDGLKTWTVTCAGCQTLVGMNERGIAVGTTNLKTWRSEVGVGYLSVLHKALTQPTLTQASAVFESAPVAGAHSYWSGSVEGGVEWERPPHQAFKRSTLHGPIGRSNHCLFDFHQANEGVPPTQSSLKRLERLNELLMNDQHSIESVKELFSDRAHGVDSINRYPEDEQGTTTNSVVLASPSEKTLYACRGSADRGEWVSLHFENT